MSRIKLTRFSILGSGIGKACAIGLAKEGAAGVLIGDINLDAATKIVAEAQAVATNSSFRAEAVKIDVTDEESVRDYFKRAVELFERIDYVVSCVGVRDSPPSSAFTSLFTFY